MSNNEESPVITEINEEESAPVQQQTKVEFTEEETKQILDTTVSVKIAVINQLATVLDVCVKRNVFKTDELENISALYKLLINAVTQAAKLVKEGPKETLPSIEEETSNAK